MSSTSERVRRDRKIEELLKENPGIRGIRSVFFSILSMNFIEDYWMREKVFRWKKKGVYGEVCWLCNAPFNTTYVGHFHFLYVINAVNSESSLVNEAVKTGVGGDQQNLCKQIVVTCHLTSTFLQFMDTKNDEHRGNTKHWIMFTIIVILCWFQINM